MKNAQTDPSVKILIIGIIVLFVGSLGYYFYGNQVKFTNTTEEKAPIPEYFDYGSIANSIYCNDFFRFRITIPSKHEGAFKKYDFVEKTLLEKDSFPAKPIIAQDIGSQNLIIIEPELIKIDFEEDIKKHHSTDAWEAYLKEQSKRELSGADYQLAIHAYNLEGETLKSYIDTFENLHNPEYRGARYKSITGVKFREFEGQTMGANAVMETYLSALGFKKKNITSFVTEINGFALNIDLFYSTDEQKELLLKMVESIRLH